ncbi:peptidase S8/S53 domain-containing protein [Podospora appendiculata]|uniref:Peptidase S8/S53 domain-containing protein n=1 Tax=Podospora appendiculata TaxID=314037 RepID=A0AAE1CE78_9PEZI|nr:peptidase S8/S53 domain-containing protein [Podospora appendiculata]
MSYSDFVVVNRDQAREPCFNVAGKICQCRDKHRSRASAGDSHHSKVDEAVVRKVERFLKLHYLRNRSHDVCMEILNGRDVTSDVELYFDLSGRTSMKETGLISLLSRLKFEDILQYVAIPNIRIEPRHGGANSKRDLRKRDIASASEGCQDLVQVFDSLRKKGLKTVLKVVVDDSFPHPHSDEAIENALRGMDVEVWDWKRIDLSSKVIYNAAPRVVREVHLYWSGNNAVIRGWGDEGGLKKLKELKKFRTLLVTAEHTYKQKKLPENIEEHVKIALIDDGVDVTDPDLPEALELSGRTFCTRNGHGEHSLNHPYYASGAGHGTTMAKQIYSMCPSAQLYVLRLEDHPSDDGRTRQLDAKSAARAIRAAAQKGVHIISMSWTILPPEDAAVEQMLDQAVKAADQANILMFCSASDKGVKKSDTYPAKGTNRIFTIGAAKASGIKEQWVPQGVTTVTGSSVATALAAGLAALVLYCVQARLAVSTAEHEREKARRQFRLLKRHENMHRAFGHSIGTTEGSEYKFLAVWDVFGKACEKADAAPAHEDERLIEFVAGVGSALCMKLP